MQKDVIGINITNANNQTYNFSDEDIYNILIWAFGYIDLYEKRLLPIDFEDEMKELKLRKKLRQCMEGHLEIQEKIRRH